MSKAPTANCCYRCHLRVNPPPQEPASLPPAIGISEGYQVQTVLESAIRPVMVKMLEDWREKIWEEDWRHGHLLPKLITSDKMIASIAKGNASVLVPEDFSRLSPPWTLWPRYGQQLLDAIQQARLPIEQEWAARQEELDEERRKRQEEETSRRERERRRLVEEREMRQQQLEEAKEEKKRAKNQQRVLREWEKQNEKWEAYSDKIGRGERPKGKAPRNPGPRPETD